jgi:menaquinone-dependent protoporphyrinogen oxidase
MISDKILVTYASQGGSTTGVAEAIGKTLSANGIVVDVCPIREATDLHSYRAVIIGSAVHSGKWMPDAIAFVERNQATLRRIPTGVFQVCMMLATSNEQYKRMVADWLAPLQAQIQPVAEASFAGALWPNKYSKLSEKLGLRIFLAAIHLKAGDYRDWDVIRIWAERVGPMLSQ